MNNLPPGVSNTDQNAPWNQEQNHVEIYAAYLNAYNNKLTFDTSTGDKYIWLDHEIFTDALDEHFPEWEPSKVEFNESDASFTLFCKTQKGNSFSIRIAYSKYINHLKSVRK